jgi:hypothetical protein
MKRTTEQRQRSLPANRQRKPTATLEGQAEPRRTGRSSMAIIRPGPAARQPSAISRGAEPLFQPVVLADLRPVTWAGFDVVGG